MIVNTMDGVAHLNPLIASGPRTGPAAIFGWPQTRRMEDHRTNWVDRTDDDEQRRLAEDIQNEGLKVVVLIPPGGFLRPSARRKTVSGIAPAVVPLFWPVRKT